MTRKEKVLKLAARLMRLAPAVTVVPSGFVVAGLNKYNRPHQSARECERRVNQRIRGLLI